jgi:hypothetical protein
MKDKAEVHYDRLRKVQRIINRTLNNIASDLNKGEWDEDNFQMKITMLEAVLSQWGLLRG